MSLRRYGEARAISLAQLTGESSNVRNLYDTRECRNELGLAFIREHVALHARMAAPTG